MTKGPGAEADCAQARVKFDHGGILYRIGKFCQGTLSQILAGSPDVPNCLDTLSQIVIIPKTISHAPILSQVEHAVTKSTS